MTLHRKHYHLAARCAEKKRRGYTVVLRTYRDAEHWKLAFKVFTGAAIFPCEQEVIASAETESAILELRRAFEAEMSGESVGVGR